MKAILSLLLLLTLNTYAKENVYHKSTKRTYQIEKCEGWSLYVNVDILKETKWPAAKQLLTKQLSQIKKVLKDSVIKSMQKVSIYIDNPTNGKNVAQYHPSAKWLSKNSYSPKKVGCVDIANISSFTRYSKTQPWVLLHELIHSYHHQVLKFNHKEIMDCYKEVMVTDKYKKVSYINDRTRNHYARTDHKEYFSEAAEVYFGKNDFFHSTKLKFSSMIRASVSF